MESSGRHPLSRERIAWARTVDDRFVVVQHRCEVRSGEDRSEFECDLVGLGVGIGPIGGVRIAGRLREEVTPLALVVGHAVA
jgi:hypothetical protein